MSVYTAAGEPARARRTPCPSCPYRRDVPSGVWDPEEYHILPKFDGEIAEQAERGALLPFHCHTTPSRLCSGWVGHRDPDDLLAVRLGLSWGTVDPSVPGYRTSVPLFATGAEAAAHGLRDVEAPSVEARQAIAKIVRRHRGLSPDRPTDPA